MRHRVGVSYSQKSQRYVGEGNGDSGYVTPASIAENPVAREMYRRSVEQIFDAYRALSEIVPREDARYILPNATGTNLVVTFNARSLLHFFQLRCCLRAQWEIRELAGIMLELVREKAPRFLPMPGLPVKLGLLL